MVVARLTLFVALGGGTYAAIKLKPNSVKTKNLKNGAVKTNKIADAAVTSGKLANGAVTNAKLAADARGIKNLTTRVASASLGPTGTFNGVDLTANCPGRRRSGRRREPDQQRRLRRGHLVREPPIAEYQRQQADRVDGVLPDHRGAAHTVTTYAVCAS